MAKFRSIPRQRHTGYTSGPRPYRRVGSGPLWARSRHALRGPRRRAMTDDRPHPNDPGRCSRSGCPIELPAGPNVDWGDAERSAAAACSRTASLALLGWAESNGGRGSYSNRSCAISACSRPAISPNSASAKSSPAETPAAVQILPDRTVRSLTIGATPKRRRED